MDMKKIINITITGDVGCGKTTLTIALQKFLVDQGFTDVKISDRKLLAPNHNMNKLQDKRLEAIKDNDILISTNQVQW